VGGGGWWGGGGWGLWGFWGGDKNQNQKKTTPHPPQKKKKKKAQPKKQKDVEAFLWGLVGVGVGFGFVGWLVVGKGVVVVCLKVGVGWGSLCGGVWAAELKKRDFQKVGDFTRGSKMFFARGETAWTTEDYWREKRKCPEGGGTRFMQTGYLREHGGGGGR